MGLKRIALILLIVLAALLYSYNNKNKANELTRSGFAMNTVIKITASGGDKKILDDAFEFLNKFERQISLYDPNSQLSKINNSAGINPVKVSSDVINIISQAVNINKITGGVFNPLIGAVTKLWRINDADNNKIPAPASIDAAIKLININIINIDEKNEMIYLDKAGAVLDLSGIAKGYASAKIAEKFKKAGIKRALIDLGGNIQVVGENFNIGIRDPLNKAAVPALAIKAANEAVITSGNYERYKIIDGVKYSHFFDPKTGAPVKNNMLSATVINQDGALADALATSFMIMGHEKALEFIDKYNIKTVLMTSGDKIKVFKNF